jgi:ribosomal-protein-alanine N-acetyltransferase
MTTAVVAIEPMSAADLPAAIAIDATAFAGHETGDAREKQLEAELARPWARLRVARGDGGVVVGYLLFWHVADEAHLLNVAVAPAMRRRGIGRALVEHLLAYARGNAVAKILLEVRASNRAAIALYEELGFAEINVRKGYYADGEDAVEMMRTSP